MIPKNLNSHELTQFWAANCAATDSPNAAYKQATTRAALLRDNPEVFSEVFNSNSIDSSLKRHAVLQTVIADFGRRLLPLNLFSTVFSNVPLEGTNKVQVPFYDLDTSASDVFEANTGYDVIGNTTTSTREITVGTGATDGGRWYQGLSFTSEEIVRQPFLKVAENFRLKLEKLASDIVADVLSVVTLANFGAASGRKRPFRGERPCKFFSVNSARFKLKAGLGLPC